jgi:hypothetical protein
MMHAGMAHLEVVAGFDFDGLPWFIRSFLQSRIHSAVGFLKCDEHEVTIKRHRKQLAMSCPIEMHYIIAGAATENGDA